MAPVPPGVPGELYLGGDGIGRGYLNRPELTEEKFVRDPFRADVNARLYRTGDIGYFQSDGNIEFLGRVDGQLKIRGCRIEPAEIEAVVTRHPGVQNAVVTTYEDPNGAPRLVAYWTAAPAGDQSAGNLRTFLKRRLPQYMVPSSLIQLDSIPLTANGKLDRKRLPPPGELSSDIEPAPRKPETPIQTAMLAIWSKVLRNHHIGIDDDFFDVGGDSLLAVQVLLEVEKVLDTHIPLPVLFQGPTVRQLATAAVPAPVASPGSDYKATRQGAPPQTGVQSRLAEIWREALSTGHVGIADNFFRNGGDSTGAASVIAQVEETFGIRLPENSMQEAPTIEELARVLSSRGLDATWRSIITLQPAGSQPPLFCVHESTGDVLCYREFARSLGADRPVYGLQGYWADETLPLYPSIGEMAAHNIRCVKNIQPRGPYYLTGHCFGGVVAFEMAQQLARSNDRVGLLVLLDSPGPPGSKLSVTYLRYLANVALRFPAPAFTYWRKEVLPPLIRRLSTPRRAAESRRETDATNCLRIAVINNTRAIREYRPERYAGRITHLVNGQRAQIPYNRWFEFAADGVDLQTFQGVHGDIFSAPTVFRLAEKVKQCLDLHDGPGRLLRKTACT